MHKEDISYDKDDLKVIIDDEKLDINVLEYIKVKEKYDFYLRCIRYFDNFITLEHLISILDGKVSRTKIFNDMNELSDLRFIKKQFIGKSSYYILTRKATIYLNKKNEGGYIKTPSNKRMINNLLLLDYLIDKEISDKRKVLNDSINESIYEFKKLSTRKRIAIYTFYEIMKELKLEINFGENTDDFFDNQIVLLKDNGKDILSKLKYKNAHIQEIYKQDGKVVLKIIILDNEDLSAYNYRNIILDIENMIKELYFNQIEDKVKYELNIISMDLERENYLKKSLKDILEFELNIKDKNVKWLFRHGEGIIRDNDMRVVKEKDLLFAFKELKVLSYNTIRFFKYKNLDIKSIDSSEINVIELCLNKEDLIGASNENKWYRWKDL